MEAITGRNCFIYPAENIVHVEEKLLQNDVFVDGSSDIRTRPSYSVTGHVTHVRPAKAPINLFY